jgi:hypothetical protein
MEAVFNDFDYGLRKDNDYHIIKRDAVSSFLTKKLRAYGGDGIHEGYEVGRVLKNIVFSGKGYVEKPANPDSTIFSSDQISKFSFASAKKDEFFGVYNNRMSIQKTENINMSAELLEKQVADLQSQLAEAKKESEQAKAELNKVGAESLKTEIESLSDQLSKANDKNSELEKTKACMCDQFNELKKDKEALEAKYEEILKEQELALRVDAFIKKGYSEKEAKAKVEELKSFSAENFQIAISMVSDKKEVVAKTESFTTDEEIAEAVETEVETEKIAPTEITTASLEVKEQTDDKKEVVFASIANHFSKVLGGKTKKEIK